LPDDKLGTFYDSEGNKYEGDGEEWIITDPYGIRQ